MKKTYPIPLEESIGLHLLLRRTEKPEKPYVPRSAAEIRALVDEHIDRGAWRWPHDLYNGSTTLYLYGEDGVQRPVFMPFDSRSAAPYIYRVATERLKRHHVYGQHVFSSSGHLRPYRFFEQFVLRPPAKTPSDTWDGWDRARQLEAETEALEILEFPPDIHPDEVALNMDTYAWAAARYNGTEIRGERVLTEDELFWEPKYKESIEFYKYAVDVSPSLSAFEVGMLALLAGNPTYDDEAYAEMAEEDQYLLNTIVDGGQIEVNQKFIKAYEITSRAKIIWAMNELPKVSSVNNGIYRRPFILILPKLVEIDTTILPGVQNEAAGILNWALDGLDSLADGFKEPEQVKNNAKAWLETNDQVARFVSEWLQWEEDALELPRADTYPLFQAWARSSGIPEHYIVRKQDFNKALVERKGFVEGKDRSGVRHWRNWVLSATGEEESERAKDLTRYR